MFDFITAFAPPDAVGAAFWLPLVWATLLAIAVAMYVVADGFDLGVGILFNAAGSENWRDRMMLSVAPIWDGNETWLILGGGGLLAVFGLAYAVLLPALYIPLIVMLIALIFRGVAFEFRFKAETSKRIWDYAFHYGLLGATWCVMKTTGDLEIWARKMALRFLVGTIVSMGIVSLWVPFLGLDIERRWFSWPNIAYLAPVPLVTAYVAYQIYRTLETGRHSAPFLLSILMFLLGFLGLAISLFPYIIPPGVTIWQASNHPSSQMFALYGYAVVMPLTFAYTAYAYWVFRGKVAEDVQSSGYH